MNLIDSIMYHDRDYLKNVSHRTGDFYEKPRHFVIKSIEQNSDGTLTIETTNSEKFEIRTQASAVADLRIGDTLFYDDGKLQVKTTNEAELDNTLPITSAGVAVQIGNIDVLLGAI